MGATTEISWTDHTFNPWLGCTKVHAGCTNCYAEAFNKRTGKAKWGDAGTRIKTSEANWRGPWKWNADAQAGKCQACSGKGWVKDQDDRTLLKKCERCGNTGMVGPHRRRVFCSSLADIFEDWVGQVIDHNGKPMWCHRATNDELRFADDDGWMEVNGWEKGTLGDLRRMLFALIDATPWLDWQLLTKRPENVPAMWPATQNSINSFHNFYRDNVWLGTSISDQQTAEEWIKRLLPSRDLAPVLFLSAEPLLGPIDLRLTSKTTAGGFFTPPPHYKSPIDWLIIGGESGGKRRDCGLYAISNLAQQARAARCPVFVKQDSAMHPGQQGRIPDDIWALKQFPKQEHVHG
jgi:protein gp37